MPVVYSEIHRDLYTKLCKSCLYCMEHCDEIQITCRDFLF
jgi:hypothetical protein